LTIIFLLSKYLFTVSKCLDIPAKISFRINIHIYITRNRKGHHCVALTSASHDDPCCGFAVVSYLIYRLTFFQQIFITFWSHSIHLTTKPFTAFRLASGLSDPRLISSARSENVIHSSCRRFNLIDYFPKRLFVEHKLFALVFIIFCSNLPDSLLILIFHVLILMSLYKYVCTEVWINTNTRMHTLNSILYTLLI